MKKGDLLRVFIENIPVAQAEITAVREGEIEVTVPGFVSVIATRTSLTDAPTSLEENNSNREVRVTGLEVVDNDGQVVDAVNVDQPTTNASSEPSTAPQTPSTNEVAQTPQTNVEAVTTPSTATHTEAPAPELPVENG